MFSGGWRQGILESKSQAPSHSLQLTLYLKVTHLRNLFFIANAVSPIVVSATIKGLTCEWRTISSTFHTFHCLPPWFRGLCKRGLWNKIHQGHTALRKSTFPHSACLPTSPPRVCAPLALSSSSFVTEQRPSRKRPIIKPYSFLCRPGYTMAEGPYVNILRRSRIRNILSQAEESLN